MPPVGERDFDGELTLSWLAYSLALRLSELSDEADRRMQCAAYRARQPRFHLMATMLAAQTPFAEVFAVVGQ
jgi:hypothetical protein